MSKTRQQIQFKVIAILTGGDVGAPVSDEDATTIDGYIDSEVAELNSDGTCYIDDPDTLDDGLFTTFCKLVANAAAEEFGGKSDENAAQQFRNRIRVLTRQTPGYGPQAVEYF
ncbi:hypothetical protein [Bradyrhizobium elkanii]|uniref:hypothetical protein n=1 Tax=Bradyrhizobium elkanii TaxID=29448 RepID=UPI001448DA55|nr:hypothetical protein [Bradyrhizobium elkanii]MCP1932517.1 hypothetical protein [Bradyrhizobium elkanii]MCS3479556.1 hypothetical protein [Bradyrhizobium elkanii]MCS3576941.1 hypothetical protein [Bradyrhizobium elkanii]MCS3719818.1 hypothetical protein [Bradyrhizobium elkanii]MCS4004235.1 hypothetical protein [Bradyrhizobium elkanii USDA 61]